MAEKKQVYLFNHDDDRIFTKAIEKNIAEQATETKKETRKERTERMLNAMKKYMTARELAQMREMMESVSDAEFFDICQKADMITNMLMPDEFIKQ